MRKMGLTLAFLATALLAACGQAATPAPTLAEPTAPAPPPTQPTAAGTNPADLPASTCTLVSVLPTPGPTEASLYPPVTEQDWALGPADAKITILEYSDFQ